MNQIENPSTQTANNHRAYIAYSSSADPEAEIEKLMLKTAQRQKGVALHLKTAYRKEKTKTLERAFGKMQDAGWWKIGGTFLNVALKVGATVLANYCGDKTGLAAKAAAAALDATGNNNVLGYKVDEYNLEAEQKKSAADVSGMRRADYDQWLKDTRSLENRMLERLESMEAKRHEAKRLASS